MIQIKVSDLYINKENIVRSSGKYILPISHRALIIGGRRSLETVKNSLLNSLDETGILYKMVVHSGLCTKWAIQHFSATAKEVRAGVVIGVGGGSVLDVAKAVAAHSQLPIVTIPTIAATCAAWSALSVIHEQNGKVIEHLPLESSPSIVLADTKILVEAPVRYLQSGIGGTIVKWYENVPNHHREQNDLAYQVSLNTAKQALTVLKSHAVQAIEDHKQKQITTSFQKVVDAVLALAGLSGSIQSERKRFSTVQAILDSMTGVIETQDSLHGEKAVFGLTAQFFLEGKSKTKISQFISTLNQINLPVTLNQLGIKEEVLEQKVKDIALGIKWNPEALDLPYAVNPALVEEAIKQADRHGKEQLTVTADS